MPTKAAAPETLDAVRARAAIVADLKRQLAEQIAALRQEIVTADRDGHGRNRIVAVAEGGLSRMKVYAALGAADLYATAEQALREAGYTADDYRLTAGPSAVTLALATDAGEPDAPVSDHRDYREGDPYWGDRLDDERRRAGVRRRNLANGILSALARAGITAAGDAEEALLDYESVILSAVHQ